MDSYDVRKYIKDAYPDLDKMHISLLLHLARDVGGCDFRAIRILYFEDDLIYTVEEIA